MIETGAARITYSTGKHVTVDQVVSLFVESTLADRRPVNDRARIAKMLEHANLTVTAWDQDRLVGIARCLTDFSYAAYLSDLAVDRAYQKRGIGRELVRRVQQAIDPGATVVLLAAPSAVDYYPKIGMRQHPSAWTIPATAEVR